MYKLCFYVPVEYCEKVKAALFVAGAGKTNNYDYCAWQTLGTGQFRPLSGSKPFVGQEQQLKLVEEFKVELVCVEQYLKAVIDALKASHPYEEPAYQVIPLIAI